MYGLIEKIADGWQYFISFFANIGHNFHIISDYAVFFYNYVYDFLVNFTAPQWFITVMLFLLSLGFACRLLHWGRD